MTVITEEEIKKKVGAKGFFDFYPLLAAKLEYISGIEYFDNVLKGQTLNSFKAVIHFEKYPKGFVFKIAKNLGFTIYSYPLENKNLKKVVLTEVIGGNGKLTFCLSNNQEIKFGVS